MFIHEISDGTQNHIFCFNNQAQTSISESFPPINLAMFFLSFSFECVYSDLWCICCNFNKYKTVDCRIESIMLIIIPENIQVNQMGNGLPVIMVVVKC